MNSNFDMHITDKEWNELYKNSFSLCVAKQRTTQILEQERQGWTVDQCNVLYVNTIFCMLTKVTVACPKSATRDSPERAALSKFVDKCFNDDVAMSKLMDITYAYSA